MLKIKISAELERTLRKRALSCRAPVSQPVLEEIVALIDDARVAQAAGKPPAGMDYHSIVREFRRHLGDGLALPPAPDEVWIRNVVAKAKRQGLNERHIDQICAAVLRRYPKPPYRLEWMVQRATDLLHRHNDHNGSGGGEEGVEGGVARVVTGRPRETP